MYLVRSYTSIKIKDAVRDRAVKQIICDSRQTELHLQNKIIGEDFDKLTEGLDPESISGLSKKWSQLQTVSRGSRSFTSNCKGFGM